LPSASAREDCVAGTTVIVGESVLETPSPIAVSAPATTTQIKSAVFGFLIENFARVIIAFSSGADGVGPVAGRAG
jgi:hypothetical protein